MLPTFTPLSAVGLFLYLKLGPDVQSCFPVGDTLSMKRVN